MKIVFVLAVTAVIVAGCTSTDSGWPTEVIAAKSPVNEHAGIRKQNQGNIIGSYNHRKPTDPTEWRRLNNEQTSTLGGG